MSKLGNHHPSLCSDCGRSIPVEIQTEDFSPCPCGRRKMSTLLFLPPKDPPRDDSLGSSSACFIDPEKSADQICSECGCMMNHLYDFYLGDYHFCVDCLHRMRERKDPRVLSFKTRYDLMAFYTALLGFFIFWLSIITAPAAIALAVIHWKKPQSLVGKSRGYFVAAILIALLQCLGWVGLFVYLMYQWFGGSGG